jgi:toxin ParE1/3/4
VKPAIRSALAEADIGAAVDFYLAESVAVAGRFIDALELAVLQIEAHPESGSPRYAHELDLPQLRASRIRRFPYVLFYVEHGDHLDVIRCLHTSRDIPATFRFDEG